MMGAPNTAVQSMFINSSMFCTVRTQLLPERPLTRRVSECTQLQPTHYLLHWRRALPIQISHNSHRSVG
jgi:hypothetical protein